MANLAYSFDQSKLLRRGYGNKNWNLMPEGWQETGLAGDASGDIGALTNTATAATPGLGLGTFALQQGIGLAGKGISYMFGGGRGEAKEAKGDYKKDRAQIEAGMNESPYSLGEFQTFATRGMHNYRSTVAKQIADIADINATDVQGAIAEQGAVQGQNGLMDAFLNARMARFNNRADSRRALLQASLQRYLEAQR
jgi:hypothetical protein